MAAAIVVISGAGVLGIWLALAAWLAARFITLTGRARGDRWLITGAVRP